MAKTWSFLFLIVSFPLFSQTKKKILFIGNSYTYVNNLPQLITDIALSKSDSVIYDQSTPGGFTFSNHCSNSSTWSKIRSQKWDVVILQGQSQEPSIGVSQVMSQTYPYVKQLCDSIRTNNSCSEILFYMTWGRKNGDVSNCPTYPQVCTYSGMQARLRESYIMFKDSFISSVAPVGVAWKNFRNLYPLIDLFQVDESHPSLHGSYLAACVFYSAIFKKTTIGSSYNPSLPSVDVANIQTISSQTVLDSTSIWNLGSNKPTAAFSFTTTSPQVYQFTNYSINATNYFWSFGSNVINPTYTFTATGNFTVSLIATNGCTNDTTTKTITVPGLNEIGNLNNEIVFFDSKISFKNMGNNDIDLAIYSNDGKNVMNLKKLNYSQVIDVSALPTAIYVVTISSQNGTFYKKIAIAN